MSVAVARCRVAAAGASPTPLSVPRLSATLTVVDVEYVGAPTEPPAGAVESLTKLSVVGVVLPATSAPVTVSVGALVVPPVQVKALDTYGPPLGVVTVEAVWL